MNENNTNQLLKTKVIRCDFNLTNLSWKLNDLHSLPWTEDYWVVYTDYVDHALIYSCGQLSSDGSCQAGMDNVWFLARVGGLSYQARHHMMSLMSGLCVDAARITHVPTGLLKLVKYVPAFSIPMYFNVIWNKIKRRKDSISHVCEKVYHNKCNGTTV